MKKLKRPSVGNVEKENERDEAYEAKNPKIDLSRTKNNYHIVDPPASYMDYINERIASLHLKRKVRSDAIYMNTFVLGSGHEFFEGMPTAKQEEFFEDFVKFFADKYGAENIISAVVHMDEKTPHMHLCFVPLTSDGRLSAKEIVGNKKKLGEWQDAFWTHMAESYPELERGESAGETGREHIPPRLFKQMTRLTRQKQKLDALLSDVKLGNYKERVRQISALLDKYIPDVERMGTELKKYKAAFDSTGAELKALRSESTLKKLRENQLRRDYEEALALIGRLPPEVLRQYQGRSTARERETVSK